MGSGTSLLETPGLGPSYFWNGKARYFKYDTQVDNGKYTESHTALQAFSLMVRKISLSAITPANPNQAKPNLAEMHRSRGDNVQEILGTKRGLGSPAQTGFLSPIEDILSNF